MACGTQFLPKPALRKYPVQTVISNQSRRTHNYGLLTPETIQQGTRVTDRVGKTPENRGDGMDGHLAELEGALLLD